MNSNICWILIIACLTVHRSPYLLVMINNMNVAMVLASDPEYCCNLLNAVLPAVSLLESNCCNYNDK